MSEKLGPERPVSERLKEWLNNHKINVVLFDLDDTLIITRDIFQKQMRRFIEFASALLPDCDATDLWSNLEQINDNAFKTFAVTPKRWAVVVERMSELYGSRSREVFRQGLPILMEIYKILPKFHEGALPALEQFSSTGIAMGLVTHANEDWTNFKLEGLNLRHYFRHILIVDQDKHKGLEDWQKAIELFEAKPENALVIGDSLPGDIRAAASIGVKHLLWIPSQWRMYNFGEIPEGTIKIEGIGKIVETLINQI